MSDELVFINLLETSSDKPTLPEGKNGASSKNWVKDKIIGFFKRIKHPFRPSEHRSRQPIHLVDWEEERTRHKRAVIIGSTALVLFGLAVVVGWHKRVTQARGVVLSAMSDHAEYAMGEAANLSDLEPGRAYDLLSGELDRVDGTIASSRDPELKQALTTLKQRISEARDIAAKITPVRPDEYLDLSLVREGARGHALNATGETMYVLDSSSPAVFSVSATHRAATVIGGGDALKGARAIASDDHGAYALTSHAIVEFDSKTLASTTIVTDDGGVWNDPIALAIFGGNAYVLDRATSELYKYTRSSSGDGFGDLRRWLHPGVVPDLSDAIRLAVDGSVWVLTTQGKITKFEQGERTGYHVQWSEALTEPVGLSVPPGGSKVWVLDRGGKRVVAFDRASGSYVGQWTSGMFSDATDLVVSEELKKAFVLVNEKIYEMEIS